MVGSLASCWRKWEEIIQPRLGILMEVKGGLSFAPSREVAVRLSKKRWGRVIESFSKEQWAWLQAEVRRIQETGAVTVLGRGEFPARELKFASPVFLTKKKGPKKWRLVVDMREVNKGIVAPKFKYEKLEDFARLLRRNYFLFTLDLKEGYFHQRLAPEAAEWCGAVLRDQDTGELVWLRYNVLPFGLSLSPWHFSMLVKATFNYWRKEGIVCMAYLDDWVFGAPSLEEALRLRDRIEQDMEAFGWIRHREKGCWMPAQRVEYLGVVLDTVSGRWYVPEEKIQQLIRLATPILEEKEVTVRRIAKVVGKVISMSRALPLAKLYVRETFQEFIEFGLYERGGWLEKMRLQGEALEDLRLCIRMVRLAQGAPMWRPVRKVAVYADATLDGWGGYIHGRERDVAGGEFGKREVGLPIHMKEGLAVLWTLRTFEKELRGRNIVVFTDNMWVYWYLRNLGGNGRGWQREMTNVTKEVYAWAMLNDASIVTANWIPSELNVVADEASRVIDHGNWSVNKEVFEIAEQHWGPHSVDRMATNVNTKCPRFNAWRSCPGVEAIDCLAQDWKGENNWVVPPLGMIPVILRFILEEGAEATILVPTWNAPWKPLLLAMELETVVLKGSAEKLFKRGSNGGEEVFKNKAWRFQLTRVSGVRGRQLLAGIY